MEDSLIYFGDAVKALDESGRVGGYLVKFGSPSERDLEGQYFTAGGYYGPSNGDGAEALINHGFPRGDLSEYADYRLPPLKTRRDETGIWAEVSLDKSKPMEMKLWTKAHRGELGWSSGAAPHRVKIKRDGAIIQWPLAEGSLTPTPMNPRSRAIALKSYLAQDIPTEAFGIPSLKALITSESVPDELLSHSEAVATAAQEYVALTTAFVKSLEDYTGRAERKAEFRAQEGRTLSGANLDLMEAHITSLTAVKSVLQGLVDRARKPQADKAKSAELRAKWLRMEAARHGVDVAA